MKPAADYRPDIDGLRAIAVLSVLIFHYGATWMPGGFVGVDVFFVISGYLITGLILKDLNAGTFSFGDFYLRRARRILPALFTVLAASSAVAFAIMTPEDLAAFSGSLVAAALSVSNLWFWAHSSYFDVASELSPLLHTWSLGVEEQFYLLLPVTIVLLYRWMGHRAWIGLALVGLASFVLNLMFQDGYTVLLQPSPEISALFAEGQKAIFFLTPFRIFEFVIGGLISFTSGSRSAFGNVIYLIGACLLGFAFVTYDEATMFPSWAALPPCVGAALMIHYGRGKVGMTLLGNPVAAFLGRISYSLYLIHWPLIVFYRHIHGEPSLSALVLLTVSAFALSVAMYWFVETPFRSKSNYRVPSFRILASVTTAAALAITVLNVISYADGGAKWRLSKEAQEMVPDWSDRGEIMGSIGCDSKPCEFGNLGSDHVVLIFGDSHVDQYTRALDRLYGKDVHFKLASASSCYIGSSILNHRGPGFSNEPCRNANRVAKEWLADPKVTAVIHSQAWYGYIAATLDKNENKIDFQTMPNLFIAMLNDLDELYQDFNKPIIIAGPSMVTNISCYKRPTIFNLPCPNDDHYLGYVKLWASIARSFAAEHKKFHVIDPSEIICPGNHCQIVDSNNDILYTDREHLSVYGAKVVAPYLMDIIYESFANPLNAAAAPHSAY